MNQSTDVHDLVNSELLLPNAEPQRVLAHFASYNRLDIKFKFDFGLDKLPKEPGIILVRGPRQYGKSTWLECEVAKTLKDWGPGSALYLNCDLIDSKETLRSELVRIVSLFPPQGKVKRLFLDEITAVDEWELVLKYLVDSGPLREILVVTTGSKATDLRNSSERLPGRKGRLSRSDYLFSPISFTEFEKQAQSKLAREDLLDAYLISGGCPLACSEVILQKQLPDFVFALTRDWILGEFARHGRSRTFLLNILEALHKAGGTIVGFTKLARESGLANNTAAADYIELLGDLMCVAPSFQWDPGRLRIIKRKACKFHFINLLMANSFQRLPIATLEQFKSLAHTEKSKFYEWAVAQEIWRQQSKVGLLLPDTLKFWTYKKQEIDFVLSDTQWLEVKVGQASPHEFGFISALPHTPTLKVICSNTIRTANATSMSMQDFLKGNVIDWQEVFEANGYFS